MKATWKGSWRFCSHTRALLEVMQAIWVVRVWGSIIYYERDHAGCVRRWGPSAFAKHWAGDQTQRSNRGKVSDRVGNLVGWPNKMGGQIMGQIVVELGGGGRGRANWGGRRGVSRESKGSDQIWGRWEGEGGSSNSGSNRGSFRGWCGSVVAHAMYELHSLCRQYFNSCKQWSNFKKLQLRRPSDNNIDKSGTNQSHPRKLNSTQSQQTHDDILWHNIALNLLSAFGIIRLLLLGTWKCALHNVALYK